MIHARFFKVQLAQFNPGTLVPGTRARESQRLLTAPGRTSTVTFEAPAGRGKLAANHI